MIEARVLVASIEQPLGIAMNEAPVDSVFFHHAENYRRAGFAVLPAIGKRPLMRGFGKWSHAPSQGAVETWRHDHPEAAIAYIPGLSRPLRSGGSIVTVDADDEGSSQRAVTLFGETPGIVQTRRGRHHLYRLAGDLSVPVTSLRAWGLSIDLKHGHSVVIAPPSRHATDPSVAYAWIGCTPEVIRDLPPFDIAALNRLLSQGSISLPNVTGPRPPAPCMRDGSRGQGLNDTLVAQAWACDTFDDLLDVARTWNTGLADLGLELLDDTEVIQRTTKVWNDRQIGRIERWHGFRAVGKINAEETRALTAATRPGANAVALLSLLRAEHGAKATRGELFAISVRAMVRHRVLGAWSERRLRNARNELRAKGYIRLVYESTCGPHGRTAAQYELVERDAAPALVRRKIESQRADASREDG